MKKAANEIHAALLAAKPDYRADDAIDDRTLADLCIVIWDKAADRIATGRDSDPRKAVIFAREDVYDRVGRIHGSAPDSAADMSARPSPTLCAWFSHRRCGGLPSFTAPEVATNRPKGSAPVIAGHVTIDARPALD